MSDVDDDKKDKKPKDKKPKGRAKGGVARALVLTPERRTEIARQAARAKHAATQADRPPKPMVAIRKGDFKKDFGFDAECYVLDDEQKTAVISQRGMSAAIGIDPTSGTALQRFLKGERIAPHVGGELSENLENPLVFQWSDPGAKQPKIVVHGYDVTILIDICKAIINAAAAPDGLLGRQKHIATQAHVIVNASAKSGIKGLVYALTGYDADREDTIAAFKFFVREEARDYEREFPDELYVEWYRLYQLPKPERNKPWKFQHLTVEHVYYPLARSNGRILELTRAMRDKSGQRYKKLTQFLSEIGVKALRRHLGQLLGMAQVSESRADYERFVRKVFSLQREWDF